MKMIRPSFQKFLMFSSLGLSLALTACNKDEINMDASAIGAIEQSENNDNTAPIAAMQDEQLIEGQYIVEYNDNAINTASFKNTMSYEDMNSLVREETKSLLAQNNIGTVNISNVYSSALVGFSAQLTAEQVTLLKNDPSVKSVEQDRIITLGKGKVQPSNITGTSTQTICYGTSRVGSGSGVGKRVWIIDTGVDMDHPDLTVDQSKSKSFVTGLTSPDDGFGHGTHVAGIIAAKDNGIGIKGVAAGATIVSLRVMDATGRGATSFIVAALDYASANAGANDVINMSLGSNGSYTLDNAVTKAANYGGSLKKGLLIAVAAGNFSKSATTMSPARVNHAKVFTVSAMDANDSWASFSNYGTPVDFIAPGVNILSTYKDGGYTTMSGTSMAAPHVAGLLLLKQCAPSVNGYVSNDPDGTADKIAHY
jgi:subtilisin family serine protease